MQTDRFLQRLERADASRRVEIVRLLAEAYDQAPMSDADRETAVTVFTMVLDDPSVRVRRALSQALCHVSEPPYHVVRALAEDIPDVGATLIETTNVLREDDLVDIAALGGEAHRMAIARRAHIGVALGAALVEISGAAVCLELLGNAGAHLSLSAVQRLAERYGSEAAVRTVLLSRHDLPVETRQHLAGCVAHDLEALVVARSWMTKGSAARLMDDALERAAISGIEQVDDKALRGLVLRLSEAGRLTPGFLLRALCLGNMNLVRACFVEMTGVPDGRLSALLFDRSGGGRRSVLMRTGFDRAACDALDAVLAVFADMGLGNDKICDLRKRVVALERAITILDTRQREGQAQDLMPLFFRLSGELRREAARADTDGYFVAAA